MENFNNDFNNMNFDDITAMEIGDEKFKLFLNLQEIKLTDEEWDRVFDLFEEMDKIINHKGGDDIDWKMCG